MYEWHNIFFSWFERWDKEAIFTKDVKNVGLEDAMVKYGSLDLRKATYKKYTDERSNNRPITIRTLTFLEKGYPAEYLDPKLHKKVRTLRDWERL